MIKWSKHWNKESMWRLKMGRLVWEWQGKAWSYIHMEDLNFSFFFLHSVSQQPNISAIEYIFTFISIYTKTDAN